jgi:putative endonuclease
VCLHDGEPLSRRLYIGVTTNLPARIVAHREGRGFNYVQDRALSRLVWADQFPKIDKAIQFEKRLKRWRREWKFD